MERDSERWKREEELGFHVKSRPAFRCQEFELFLAQGVGEAKGLKATHKDSSTPPASPASPPSRVTPDGLCPSAPNWPLHSKWDWVQGTSGKEFGQKQVSCTILGNKANLGEPDSPYPHTIPKPNTRLVLSI